MPMEKQGTAENQLAHTIDQTEYDSRYDRTAKKLLANKQILAQIMKGCVNEFVRSTPSGFVLSRQMVLKIRLPGTPSNPNS